MKLLTFVTPPIKYFSITIFEAMKYPLVEAYSEILSCWNQIDVNEMLFFNPPRKVKNAAVKNNNQLSGLKKFNPKAKTYFIIHGWNGGGDKADGWAQKMLDALLRKVSKYLILVFTPFAKASTAWVHNGLYVVFFF